MTKNEFLLKLIRQKEHWIYPMPKFGNLNHVIKLKTGSSYIGVVRVQVEQDLPFECYIESLKGLVQPVTEMISTAHPVIEFRIDSQGLKEGYVYDDLLFCYYAGGKQEIPIRFRLEPPIVVENVTASVIEVGSPKVKSVRLQGLAMPEVSIEDSRRCFYMNEAVKLKLTNNSKGPKRVVIRCNDELLAPTETEIYMKDEWLQEWYIRKNTLVRLLNSLFASTPFKEIELLGYVDGEALPSMNTKVILCELKPYETTQLISDSREMKKVLLQVQRFYMNTLIRQQPKKEVHYILDLMKACLNYDQQNTTNRLLYIWLLIEFGMRKEAKSEMLLINRFEEYFAYNDDYKMIGIMNKVLGNDKEEVTLEDLPLLNPNWLQILAVARYAQLPSNKYDYYHDLYEKGIRKSFLFAEVVFLLNKHPMPPRVGDRLYISVLNWALNKSVVSNAWLNKCDRYYYQMEKNIHMTSTLAMKLYKVRPSKNFLRLCASMSLLESRTDESAFRFIENTLKEGVYLQGLELGYVKSGYATSKILDFTVLKSLNHMDELDVPVKDYLYHQILMNRVEYPLFYRKIYGKLAEEYEKRQVFSDKSCQILAMVFDDWVDKRVHFFDHLMEEELIDQLWQFDLCGEFFEKVVRFAFEKKDTYSRKWLKTLITQVGYEGVTRFITYEQTVEVYDTYQTFIDGDSAFLKRPQFEERIGKVQLNPLVMILVDEPTVDIIEAMVSFEMTKEVKEVWFYHLCKRIVMNDDYVPRELLEAMIQYYMKSKHQWLFTGIRHMLGKSDQKMEEFFYEQVEAHGIMIPGYEPVTGKEDRNAIEFFAHPESRVNIHYRYDEDDVYRVSEMEHLAFGMYVFRTKFFVEDSLDYFISIEETDGRRSIPCSGRLVSRDEKNLQDETVIEERINASLLAYQLNDEASAVAIIEEQIAYEEKVRQLNRF